MAGGLQTLMEVMVVIHQLLALQSPKAHLVLGLIPLSLMEVEEAQKADFQIPPEAVGLEGVLGILIVLLAQEIHHQHRLHKGTMVVFLGLVVKQAQAAVVELVLLVGMVYKLVTLVAQVVLGANLL